jgi:hypothetical protein
MHTLTQNQVQNVGPGRTKRHTNSNLSRSLANEIQDHAVNTNCCQRQSEAGQNAIHPTQRLPSKR